MALCSACICSSHAFAHDLTVIFMLCSRRQIRHVAARVLLILLFALGVGIVNACVLEPELRDGIATAAHSGHDHTSSNESHDGHGNGVLGDSAPHGDKSPCGKFCDETSVGAQNSKQQIDPFNAVSLGPVQSESIAVEQASAIVGPLATDPIRWRQAIPISIAFLRLTL
jgi:hypothetical protein